MVRSNQNFRVDEGQNPRIVVYHRTVSAACPELCMVNDSALKTQESGRKGHHGCPGLLAPLALWEC